MDAPIDVATLLGELDVGNDKAVAELVVSLYSELRSLASRYLRRERSDHTLQTTALVHEAYLRLADQREVRWKNREQFLGVAAQLMRRILVDYSRGHGAKKRGKGFEKVFLEEAAGFSKGRRRMSLPWMKHSPDWPNSIRSKPGLWRCVFSVV